MNLVVILAIVAGIVVIAGLLVWLVARGTGGTSQAVGQDEYCAVEAPESEIDIEEHER